MAAQAGGAAVMKKPGKEGGSGARALKTRALVPYKDPYFKEAIYGAH